MYDYIRALHAGACREPELRSTRVELDLSLIHISEPTRPY